MCTTANMSSALLPSDSDTDEETPVASTSTSSSTGKLKINQSYAKNYDRFREKEVYQRLKDKYGHEGDQGGDGESSSEEDEDEDGREWTEQVDRDFFHTLACLKGGDPSIYDKDKKFFRESKNQGKNKKNKNAKEKPLYLGDLERNVIVEKGGHFEELEDEGLAKKSRGKTYVEEQEQLRKDLKSKVEQDSESSEDDDESDGDGWLKRKVKTEAEVKQEEADYKEWLGGKKEDLGDEETKRELKSLREYWNRKDLGKDEKFLRDYILNGKPEQFDEDDDEEEEDYHKGKGRLHDSDDGLSEDEKTLNQMEQFEQKFNFRFEEPDAEFIKRYPRTTGSSLRRTENRRAAKREEAKKKKQEEAARREGELKQLKAMKRKEIEEKLARLAKVAGSGELGFCGADVDGDFNPEEHDKRMAELFGGYDGVEVEGGDEQRPEFSDLDDSDAEEALEVENWDEWQGTAGDGEEEEGYGGEDVDMDCDADGATSNAMAAQQELIESTRGRKKRRRRSKFSQAVEKKKRVFDPSKDKTYDQYLEEYYKLVSTILSTVEFSLPYMWYDINYLL